MPTQDLTLKQERYRPIIPLQKKKKIEAKKLKTDHMKYIGAPISLSFWNDQSPLSLALPRAREQKRKCGTQYISQIGQVTSTKPCDTHRQVLESEKQIQIKEDN